MKKFSIIAKEQIFKDAVMISVIILTVCIIFVACVYLFLPDFRGGFGSGIFVEFTGMLFDILVFGIVIGLYGRITERKRNQKHQQEIIDDFKKWDDEEAKHRIAGAIRRLVLSGKTSIDFSGIVLKDFNFYNRNIENIRGSVFFPIDSEGVKSYTRVADARTVLENVSFSQIDCRDVIFSDGDNSYEILDCNFYHSNLEGARFNGSHISNLEIFSNKKVILSGFNIAQLNKTSFHGCRFFCVDFSQARGIESADFQNASGLETCCFSPGVFQLLEKKFGRSWSEYYATNRQKRILADERKIEYIKRFGMEKYLKNTVGGFQIERRYGHFIPPEFIEAKNLIFSDLSNYEMDHWIENMRVMAFFIYCMGYKWPVLDGGTNSIIPIDQECFMNFVESQWIFYQDGNFNVNPKIKKLLPEVISKQKQNL